MNLLYLSTWSTILRVAATERGQPIVSFTDLVQANYHRHLQNETGGDYQVVTNDEEVYWLVSTPIATKLYKANFYPMSGTGFEQC